MTGRIATEGTPQVWTLWRISTPNTSPLGGEELRDFSAIS